MSIQEGIALNLYRQRHHFNHIRCVVMSVNVYCVVESMFAEALRVE